MTAVVISFVPSIAAVCGILVQLFLVSIRVLQHDDRVVDHDADRQDQAKQRERVDRVVRAPTRIANVRDDRHRNRQRRDDRGAQRRQEQEDDEDHQPGREQQRFLRFGDRALDEDRPVERHVERHARRERRLNRRQLAVHACRHVEHVGLRLPHDADEDRVLARIARHRTLVFGPGFDARDVAQLDELVLATGDREIANSSAVFISPR